MDFWVRHPHPFDLISETFCFLQPELQPMPVYALLKELLTKEVGVKCEPLGK